MLVEVNPLIVTSDRKVMALDAKVTLDGNSLFRHPDNAELRDAGGEDPQEQMAKERGLTYVKLDGNVGILGNGAGLVMSTLDVVAQAGGKPANFLDAGGGSKAEAITQAVEVILSDEKVTAVLFNIFGGITRCDEVAKGLIEAFDQIKPTVPFVVRLDGTNDKEGRAAAGRGRPARTCTPSRRCSARPSASSSWRASRGGGEPEGETVPPGEGTETEMGAADTRAEAGSLAMAILVDDDTKLCVSGITGREGTFHAMNNRRYGTQVVSGVTPGQGRPGRRGRPGLQHVPRRGRRDRRQHGDDLRAAALRRRLDPRGRGRRHRARDRDHRGHPRPRRAARLQPPARQPGAAASSARTAPASSRPARPTSGSSPPSFFKEGNVGVVSRSGTLTYQIGNELAQSGFGNSSIVGIGGDPVPGSSFIDIIELFEADDETELIVMAGEIGGSAEEEAAEFIAENVSKPVVAYIAGFTAPPGKTMGHAGAIVSGTKGTAAAKAEALEAKGVRVGRTPTEVAEIAAEIAGSLAR